MGDIYFDTSHAPVYLQAFHGRFAYADVDAHYDEVEEYVAGALKEDPSWRPAVFADMRKSGPLDARGRRRTAQCFTRLASMSGLRVVAHAIVLNNRIGAGVLRAILWLKRPPWPVKVFSEPSPAYEWIKKSFEEEGLPVPPFADGWWERVAASRSKQ